MQAKAYHAKRFMRNCRELHEAIAEGNLNCIIGCGPGGPATVPSFCPLKSPADITLSNGETIERKT